MNQQSFVGGDSSSSVGDHSRTFFAERSRAARRHRVTVFGQSIAREVPWDILLVLYVNYQRAHLNVSSIFADIAPHTTVLRWLSHLEKEGYVIRYPHPTDARVSYVTLSPAGKSTLDLYFDSALSANDFPC